MAHGTHYLAIAPKLSPAADGSIQMCPPGTHQVQPSKMDGTPGPLLTLTIDATTADAYE